MKKREMKEEKKKVILLLHHDKNTNKTKTRRYSAEVGPSNKSSNNSS